MKDIDYKMAYETSNEIVNLYEARIKRNEEEIERLNNIIKELEKWLYEKAETETESEKRGYCNPAILRERATLRLVYDYLKELRGDSK